MLTSYGQSHVHFQGDAAKKFAQVDVLRYALKSKALSGRPGIKRTDMAQYQAPNIVKYTDLTAQDGYAYIYYSNGE